MSDELGSRDAAIWLRVWARKSMRCAPAGAATRSAMRLRVRMATRVRATGSLVAPASAHSDLASAGPRTDPKPTRGAREAVTPEVVTPRATTAWMRARSVMSATPTHSRSPAHAPITAARHCGIGSITTLAMLRHASRATKAPASAHVALRRSGTWAQRTVTRAMRHRGSAARALKAACTPRARACSPPAELAGVRGGPPRLSPCPDLCVCVRATRLLTCTATSTSCTATHAAAVTRMRLA
mmetsp:Transcript_17004/g.52495  ORF Transcript_17004/g.52495 Transcript_17004/m.52495 type:complete len:241 (+) Transcript_17004:1347-2069(+)